MDDFATALDYVRAQYREALDRLDNETY